MGVVYEAFDEQLGQTVALKVLPRCDPDAVHNFKTEFRHVALLGHPNLVAMHELSFVDGHWFFTMERVHGVSLAEHFAASNGELDARVRGVFTQLAAAVAALHEAGLMHLDLKPSNILVEASGRVVVLDFGIARLVADAPHAQQHGTPAYMAPEQRSGGPLTAAADAFALGVILFEALTGKLPSTDDDGARPSRQRPDVAPDLDSLCAEMLRRDPAQRPGSIAVAAALAGGAGASNKAPPVPFVGRKAELRTVSDSYALALDGKAVWLHVRGPSGLGKTALVETSFRELRGAWVLRGRCYERELTPYKGLDSIVDELVENLLKCSSEMRRTVLPDRLGAAAQVFPVLRKLAPQIPFQAGLDAHQQRRLAFESIAELFRRVAQIQPLVVFIDDVQWADRDSGRLLVESFASIPSPGICVAATWRLEPGERCDLLTELRQSVTDAVVVQVIELEPLNKDEARQLAGTILGDLAPSDAGVLVLSHEAAGNPLLIELLAEAHRRGANSATSAAQLLAARLAALTASEQQLLKVVAMAGKPIAPTLALAAAGLGENATRDLSALRVLRVMVTRGSRANDPIDCYHDRFREHVVSALDPVERRALHHSLATTFEARAPGTHDALAVHWLGAGDPQKALGHALQASKAAGAALAFDREAALLGLAIESSPEPNQRRALLLQRGNALVNAGCSADAAPLFVEVSRNAPPAQRLDLERRAAEAFLVAGKTEAGLAMCRPLLKELGLPRLRSGAASIVSLLLELWRLQWRRLEFPPAPLPMSERHALQADLAWSIGRGLINVLPVEGTRLITRSVHLALVQRDGPRIGRGLAYLSSGVVGPKQVQRYRRRAEEIAATNGDDYMRGILTVASAAWHVGVTGQWELSLREADEGVAILRRVASANWERIIGSSSALVALEMMGRFSEYGERAALQLHEANARGDFYGQMSFGPLVALHRIARGDTAWCRERADQIFQLVPPDSYTVHHFYAMRLLALADLYDGEPGRGWERFLADWPKIRRAGMLFISQMRPTILLLGAQLALAHAATGAADRAALVKRALRWASALRSGQRLDGAAQALVLEASALAGEGQTDRAAPLLASGATELRERGMKLAAACADWQRARLVADVTARQQAESEITLCGVREPAKWAAMNCPGFVR